MRNQPKRVHWGLNELRNFPRHCTSSDVAPTQDFRGLKSNPEMEGDLQVDRLEFLFDDSLFPGRERCQHSPLRLWQMNKPASILVFDLGCYLKTYRGSAFTCQHVSHSTCRNWGKCIFFFFVFNLHSSKFRQIVFHALVGSSGSGYFLQHLLYLIQDEGTCTW